MYVYIYIYIYIYRNIFSTLRSGKMVVKYWPTYTAQSFLIRISLVNVIKSTYLLTFTEESLMENFIFCGLMACQNGVFFGSD